LCGNSRRHNVIAEVIAEADRPVRDAARRALEQLRQIGGEDSHARVETTRTILEEVLESWQRAERTPIMTTDRSGRKASVLPCCRYPEERSSTRTGRLTLLGLEALLLLLLLTLLLTRY
jgi:hypothetical protein